jgi:hypothetical protein
MEYQLVLQFPASGLEDYDAIIEIEDLLIDALGDVDEVDGHDAGSGEMNIFILTNDPRRAFETVQGVLTGKGVMQRLKAAFRVIGEDDFTFLHPPELAEFKIT